MTARRPWSRYRVVLLTALLACTKPSPVPAPPVVEAPAFERVPVASAVRKVKTLLVGLPATEEEVRTVEANPAALAGLVEGWMKRPEYRDKLLRFFVTAFQQDDWSWQDLVYQYCTRIPFQKNKEQFVSNMQESFARTVLALIDEGEPFTAAMTTTRFMMTPALIAGYALIDDMKVPDNFMCKPRPAPGPYRIQSKRPIPLESSIDPKSPDFMTFYDPDLAAFHWGCPRGQIDYAAGRDSGQLASLLLNYDLPMREEGQCRQPKGHYLQDSDFTDWRMVSIRQPRDGEQTLRIYDFPTMRSAREIVLDIPRVGFFSTPAFAARWPTNSSNQHRVTMNQALIVALGKPADLTNDTPPLKMTERDMEHASQETDCFSCHQSLDPMRQYFTQAYSIYFGKQEEPPREVPGQFLFHGERAMGSGIDDLGRRLASHPLFATAWVQKLCTWATSSRCDEQDPEFLRIVNTFRQNGYSWNAMAQALFSSPLVTGLTTAQAAPHTSEQASLARQEHLCATLSARLNIEDACALRAETPALREKRRTQARHSGWCGGFLRRPCLAVADGLAELTFPETIQEAHTIAEAWPSDRYGRGTPEPAMVVLPSLLTRGGLESLCANLAGRVVDTEAGPQLRSSDPAAAIDFLVRGLMGISPAQAETPRTILREHFDAARASGASTTTALQSTFVLACLTPAVSAVGDWP